ncbi:MAG: DinB family protein [Bryobacteraceae bacterium]|nr:DinB family protein [Bryobacteraceae bacterium]
MDVQHLLIDTFAYMPPAALLGDLSPEDASRRLNTVSHSILDIVAHLNYWQRWFLARLHSEAAPMAQSAALGWPTLDATQWPTLSEEFLAGLQTATALGADPARLTQPITPAIEFPPLAHYTVADVLAHIAVHNAHHLGQVVTLRQAFDLWPPPQGSFTW